MALEGKNFEKLPPMADPPLAEKITWQYFKSD